MASQLGVGTASFPPDASIGGADRSFVDDDFAPLEYAGNSILAALRDDESAPNADLYRRLVPATIPSPGSDLYYPVRVQGEGGSSAGMAARASAGGGWSASSSPHNPVVGGVRSPFGQTGIQPPGYPNPNQAMAGNERAAQDGASGAASTPPPGGRGEVPLAPTETLTHHHSLPLPPYLAEELASTRISSLMGLLPDANLVWMSVDEKLYLWSYDSSSSSGAAGGGMEDQEGTSSRGRKEDFCSFAVPSGQCVASVGLVRPKKGVFKDVVQWCLVVTTPEEAILCALATSSSPTSTTGFGHASESLRLIPTRFVIPTDSVPLLSVAGTSDGRIFLGGYDGCLYEMDYEGFFQSQPHRGLTSWEHSLEEFYDGDAIDVLPTNGTDSTVTGRILKGSKRALTSVVFPSQPHKPRKCRKINHSTNRASSFVSSVVPGFVLNATSALFFHGKSSTGGGPIVSLTLDEERGCLYTLSTRGWICAFDISTKPHPPRTSTYASAPATMTRPPPPKLTAVLDAPATARVYLDAVSRGRMNPPSTRGDVIASITFPGGSTSAMKGVGGMDGARSILKLADAEVQRGDNNRGGGMNGIRGGGRRRKKSKSGMLTPVSIHVVSQSESRSLTLVAITGGGLRYYLSSLSSSVLNAPGGGGVGGSFAISSSRRGNPLGPARKFTLCHVRAPPPVGGNDDGTAQFLSYDSMGGTGGWGGSGAGGIVPGVNLTSARRAGRRGSSVVRSYYGDGIMVLALSSSVGGGDSSGRGATSARGRGGVSSSSSSSGFFSGGGGTPRRSNQASPSASPSGDIIVTALPDFAARQQPRQPPSADGLHSATVFGQQQQQHHGAPLAAPGGMSESLSLPMSSFFSASHAANGINNLGALPGGQVWDITPSRGAAHSGLGGGGDNAVLNLVTHSTTPTDVELSVGLVPAYFPPSRIRHRPDTSPMFAPGGPTTASTALAVASSPHRRGAAAPSSSLALVPFHGGARGVVSTALTVVSNVFLNRPLRYGLTLQPPLPPMLGGTSVAGSATGGPMGPPLYRLSVRFGCGIDGFSFTASGKSSSSKSRGGGSVVSVARSSSSSSSSSSSRRRGGTPSGRGAGASSSGGTATKSARLSPWLLRPSVVPLNILAVQHLLPTNGTILALNSGGLHYFRHKSILSNLADALLSSSSASSGNHRDTTRDEAVSSFFRSYGYKEGCAMCLALAIGSGPASAGKSGEEVRRRALQAALGRAHVPTVVPVGGGGPPSSPTFVDAVTTHADLMTACAVPAQHSGAGLGVLLPPGYSFRPSSLADGVKALVSRLVRPVWHKPAVVVTEGRTVQTRARGMGMGFAPYSRVTTPAKVELLLDDVTLEEVRRPLFALQTLMRDVFKPAVSVVPGTTKRGGGDGDGMDIDDASGSGGGGVPLVTQAMQYQNMQRSGNAGAESADRSPKQLEARARLLEERNLHALYRLVSRTVQLLSLLSLLRRAQSMPDLPEVDWGLLHGLTCAQLVQNRDGQERIESLLNSLVSGTSSHQATPVDVAGVAATSAESDHLADLLASQCYLYFSSGSRYTYLGFRSANAALSYGTSTPRRVALTNQSSSYLKRAAKFWYNAPLITGRILHTRDVESYEQMARRAMEYGSPVAKAAAVLMDLDDVGGVVDVCLATASNFGGRRIREDDDDEDMVAVNNNAADAAGMVLPWERGLYHRRQQPPSRGDGGLGAGMGGATGSGPASTSISASSSSTAVVSGAEVTSADALRTCHAIVFHYLTQLLDATASSQLAEKMVSVCAASSDTTFLRSLYGHLLKTNHIDTLLRIDSPSLETWLKGDATPVRQPNGRAVPARQQPRDATLLWRYYVVQSREVSAGEVMWKRACDSTLSVTLDERMECLTRALNSYTAALEESGTKNRLGIQNGEAASGYRGDQQFRQNRTTTGLATIRRQSTEPRLTGEELQRMLTQINETLDVATLQRRVLDAVTSSTVLREQLPQASFDKLSTMLVPVSDLYNEYAGPLNLYDLCLLILHMCHHNDVQTIETLWKSIICEEILPSETRNKEVVRFLVATKAGSMLKDESVTLLPDGAERSAGIPLFEEGDWIPQLQGRVASLGKEVFGKGADYVFPLDLIVRTLEGLRRVHDAAARRRGQPWPLHCLLDVGVPYPAILESYHNAWELEDREAVGGMDPMKRLQHLSSLSNLLTSWVSSASSASSLSPMTEPRRLAGDVHSRVDLHGSSYGASLQQLSRSVSSGGLRSRIDSYKAALEGLVGSNDADEISRVYAELSDAEEAIKRIT